MREIFTELDIKRMSRNLTRRDSREGIQKKKKEGRLFGGPESYLALLGREMVVGKVVGKKRSGKKLER